MLSTLPLQQIHIDDPFFAARIDTARRIAIPYMWDALCDRIPGVAPSCCIRNFRIAAGLEEGAFAGFVFQDSDLWKWIEGVAYSLATHPDVQLEKQVDEAIALAHRAQQPDGYLDTYYIINGLDKRFTNLRDNHELYVAGHMFEAAAAYYEATGKRELLDMACRVADCIDAHFGPEEHKLHGYPGHEEVELGLAKLYRATGEKRYLTLAMYFLNVRGHQPYYFDAEAQARGENPDSAFLRRQHSRYSYHQAHVPVREQTVGAGHAVRQLYLLAGMADVGALAGDESLVEAAQRVLENIVHKQMYITGGVGSTHEGEAFSFDYDLPPERCYTETCASIALAMTAARLGRIRPDAQYGDVVERALYNGILSGVSLDGKRYFYVNPLEMWPDRCEKRQDMRVDAERLGWFGCACCPPNVLRTLTGLGQYLYATDGDELYIEQYVSSTVKLSDNVQLRMESGFPWQGSVRIHVQGKQQVKLRLRIPAWAKEYTVRIGGDRIEPEVQNGYLCIQRVLDDVLEIDFPMETRVMRASLCTPNYAGRVAVMRGPLVYCAEQADNGGQLWALRLKEGAMQAQHQPQLLQGVVTIACPGERETLDSGLYTMQKPVVHDARITLVPYYAWGNRGRGEMAVWLRHE